ncbi:hypothetical protein GOP47_0004216 [Adiantum capillus-veneris]|uniref:Uncharacterized protein n=1 Tax=Adiantum capillus-veneris TaxID=13818 RepID=A0A9D4V8F8_ADICA|nr:hypothetical protein GOP47_0004216 [Adiantum capillus-veneris]
MSNNVFARFDVFFRCFAYNLTITLFCRELLQAVQTGSLEPDLALFNASLVPDLFPLLVAAHKTVLALSQSTLVTRTLHSELIYNFSGSKHITESLRRCGLNESSTYVLVARFNATVAELEAARGLVKGKEIDLEELEKRSDKPLIQKHFKISSLELEVSSLADAVACRIAARDAM